MSRDPLYPSLKPLVVSPEVQAVERTPKGCVRVEAYERRLGQRSTFAKPKGKAAR